MNISKRRFGVIAAAVGALGALTALGLGGTSALYTSQADGQTNNIESGTIALTTNEAQNVALDLHGFMPGDTSPLSKYTLAYSGEKAFVGLDVKISSTAGKACAYYNVHPSAGTIPLGDLVANCTDTGSIPMFDGDQSAGSLDLAVQPINGNTWAPLLTKAQLEPGTACSADAAGLVTCTVEKKNILVPHGYFTGVPADENAWKGGDIGSVRVQAKLPLNAPNVFQGSTVAMDLTAHAVQYANNTTLAPGFTGIMPPTVWGTPTLMFPITF